MIDRIAPADALASARSRLAESLEILAALVETNSHADNAEGHTRCRSLLRGPLESLGFDVREVTSSAPHPRNPEDKLTRTHLVAENAPSVAGGPTVLVLGHLDTVFPTDHPFSRLERGDHEWRGPGIADMKGGIVTALLTLALLREHDALGGARFRMVLPADEEEGSPTGTSVIEEAARGVDLALCFEAARSCGGLVVGRKGYGSARIVARGRSGHAGIAHDTGVNAFTQLARFITSAEALEGRYEGLTVSPGGRVLVRPPSVTSIPDHAECEIEWRFADLAAGEATERDLRELAARIQEETGATVDILGGLEVAPMTPTRKTEQVLSFYVDAARELGMNVRGVSTAGVGDINVVAKLGATCLDGVGPEGGAFHTEREFLLVDSVARRAAMNAVAISRYLERIRSN